MTRSSALSFLVFNLTLALCAAGRRSNTTEGSHPNLHLAFIPANLHKLDGSTRSLHLTAEVVFVHLAGKNSYDQVVSSVAFRNAHLSEDLSHGSSTTSTDGTTRVEKSYKAEIYCDIRYSLYPFERPLCTLEITTANVTANEVKIGWIAEISNGAELEVEEVGDFVVDWVETDYCTSQRAVANTKTSTVYAKFPCLSWTIQLQRPVWVTLVSQFIPSIILVALTWSVHYIDRERPTMRLLVCLFAACGLAYVIDVANRDRPPAANITAIDVWAVLCFSFIGITFIEVILCHIVTKQSRKQRSLAQNDLVRVESRQRRERRLIHQNNLSMSVSRTHLNGKSFDQSKNYKEPPKIEPISNYDTLVERHFISESDYYSVMAVRIDLAARALNPICFIIAVSLYFMFYIVL